MGRKVNKNRGDALKKTKMMALSRQLKQNQKTVALETQKKKKKEEEQIARKRTSQLKQFFFNYHQSHQILLVGDGNCSFARALVRKFKDNLRTAYQKANLPLPSDPFASHQMSRMHEMDEDAEEDFEDEDFDMADMEEFEDEDDVEYDIEGNLIPKKLEFDFSNVASNLLVTCYDSQEVAMKKYDDLPEILSEILAAGGRVIFGVDAAQLHPTLTEAKLVPENRFDRVVFNFPHVGLGLTDKQENIEANQRLLLAFLTNAMPLLRKPIIDSANETPNQSKYWKGKDQGGECHITIKEGEPYSLWRVPLLARTVNMNQMRSQQAKEEATECEPGSLEARFPKLMLSSSRPFFHEKFDGYEHRRTLGFKRGLTLDGNQELKGGARTYIFTRAPKGYVDAGLGLRGSEEEQAAKAKAKALAPKTKRKKSGRVLLRGKRGKLTTK